MDATEKNFALAQKIYDEVAAAGCTAEQATAILRYVSARIYATAVLVPGLEIECQ